jgi:hypothetical protein
MFVPHIEFIAEKPASHRHDVEKALFVMLGCSFRRDNQNEAIFVDECFRFSLLSLIISVSSSSETVNSADSKAFDTN